MLVLYGGTGFIGRHLCERAQVSSCKAVAVSRQSRPDFMKSSAPDVEFCRSDDLEIEAYLKQAKTIVYLANNSRPSTGARKVMDVVSADLENVTTFTEHLFDINPNCQLIYLSSGGQIYGPDHNAPISEKADAHPVTPYALGKLLNETSLDYFRHVSSPNILTLRLANPIGHWQVGTSHGFVSAAVKSCLTGQKLTVFGEGKNGRDYFDVDDFADFILSLHKSDKPFSGTYNIGSGNAHTEKDIIEIIEEEFQRDISVTFAAGREFDLPYAVLDITHAKKDLGWAPKTPLTQSLRKIGQAINPSAAQA